MGDVFHGYSGHTVSPQSPCLTWSQLRACDTGQGFDFRPTTDSSSEKLLNQFFSYTLGWATASPN